VKKKKRNKKKMRGTWLRRTGFEANGFDWDQTFPSPSRGSIPLPDPIQDVCDFRVDQLRWLRQMGLL
jgi:hypothetical protein